MTTNIDLTEYTINTNPETDLDALDIARAAYRALPTIEFYDTYADGSVKITRTDGETLTYRIEDTEGTVDGYTYTIYDTEGDDYSTDGGPATTVSDFACLFDEITRWAE